MADETREEARPVSAEDAAFRRLLEIAEEWLGRPDVAAEYRAWAEGRG